MVLQQLHPDVSDSTEVMVIQEEETNTLLYILSDLFTDFKGVFLSLIRKFRKAPLPSFQTCLSTDSYYVYLYMCFMCLPMWFPLCATY